MNKMKRPKGYQKFRKPKWGVKLALIISTLLGVIYLMYRLKQEGLSLQMKNPGEVVMQNQVMTHTKKVLTSSEAQGLARRAQWVKKPTRLAWCRTRVSFLKKADGFELRQKDMKWLGGKTNLARLDFIEVEKWFGKHCSVRIFSLSRGSAQQKFTEALRVGFIKGQGSKLYRTRGSVFKWQGKIFRSEQLKKALLELDSLPLAKAHQ